MVGVVERVEGGEKSFELDVCDTPWVLLQKVVIIFFILCCYLLFIIIMIHYFEKK